MRVGLRTSLLSIVCVMAVSTAAFAAASIRNVGGAGTYSSAASAASATTEARSGSLRPTGTYVRPTATTSGTAKATTNGAAKTATTASRSASAPRLSIGKYIGVPKSISTQGSGGVNNTIIERIESIENTITILENTKQEIIRGSDYIIVDDNEVILNVEKLVQDLELRSGDDGRPVELDADNDDGIKWRYVARPGEPEDTWKLLVTWSAVADRIDLTEMNTYVDDSITNLKEELLADLDSKVDKYQKEENAGKVLTVDSTGHVTPGNVVYSQTEINQFIENIGDDLDTKVDKYQKEINAGKVLIVGNDGNVTLSDEVAGESVQSDWTEKDSSSGAYIKNKPTLGKLASKDQVAEEDIEDGSVTRAKAAAEIRDVLDWAAWWDANRPKDSEKDVLLSIDANGEQQWFYIVE